MQAFFRSVIDFICFVCGPFFTTYYLFDFAHGPAGPGPFYYYYRHNAKIGLGLGVALICMGIVMRIWRKGTPADKA